MTIEEERRIFAIEQAVQAKLAMTYDEDGQQTTSDTKLIEGASLIEAYLKGEDKLRIVDSMRGFRTICYVEKAEDAPAIIAALNNMTGNENQFVIGENNEEV